MKSKLLKELKKNNEKYKKDTIYKLIDCEFIFATISFIFLFLSILIFF